MLFGWAGGLYLQSGQEVANALPYAVVWGGAGMVVVAYFFHAIRRLEETGNPRLETCIGTVSQVSAKGRNGMAIASKTPVRVLRTLDATTVVVDRIDS